MSVAPAWALTPRAEDVLERAAALSAADPEYSNGKVGAEHLMLAILDDGQSVPCQVMDEQGIGRAALRAALEAKMQSHRSPTTILRRTDEDGRVVDVEDPAALGLPD